MSSALDLASAAAPVSMTGGRLGGAAAEPPEPPPQPASAAANRPAAARPIQRDADRVFIGAPSLRGRQGAWRTLFVAGGRAMIECLIDW
jgi:hypothetical protein